MISTYVDVDRFLLRGVPGCPAPSLSEQLEVSASTGSPNRIFHSKGYRSEVLAEMLADVLEEEELREEEKVREDEEEVVLLLLFLYQQDCSYRLVTTLTQAMN